MKTLHFALLTFNVLASAAFGVWFLFFRANSMFEAVGFWALVLLNIFLQFWTCRLRA